MTNNLLATAEASVIHCTPRKALELMPDIISAGLVPYLKSSPGNGKSSIVRQLFKKFNLYMIDHRLSTSGPEDMNGLPEFIDTPNGRKATFTPFDLFPLETDTIPKGYDGWGVFFDEFNHATKLVAAACYKVLLDKMIGQMKIHPLTAMVLAGNLMTDRAFANPTSTAIVGRVIILNLIPDANEWLEDVAIAENYDERIIGYIGHNGTKALSDFDPDNTDRETYASPRGWEFMNRLIKPLPLDAKLEEKVQIYTGTISPEQALAFISFSKVYKDILTIDDICRDPTGCPMPQNSQEKWATISHLGVRTTEENFPKVAKFAERLETVHRVIFYRTIKNRLPEVRQHPAFIGGLADLSNYIYGI